MRGGARPGAGRKPNREKAAMRERLDACISEEQWMGVVTQLGDAAVNGNLNAIQLLLHLRFGKPVVRSHPPAEPPALQTE